jgi:nucleoside-diphosphate-sugar epimerase
VVSLRSGRGLRDWIYLTDVVEALFRVVTMPRRGVESYDIGTGSACSVREAVETLARLMNVATDRIVCGTAKVQTMDELGFQGAQRLVPGWAPRFTLEDGLAEWIASQEGVG